MKSMPASSAMRARRAQSGQLADQRSGTLVAERPDEQLAPNTPIFSALALYMAMRSCIDAVRASTTFSIRFRTLRPIWPQLLQRRLDERSVDRIVEIDRALDQALLSVEGEIVGEARLVHPSVRVHSGRRDQFIDLPTLDRSRFREDGDDLVGVRPVEPAVRERAVVEAHGADIGAHELPRGGRPLGGELLGV